MDVIPKVCHVIVAEWEADACSITLREWTYHNRLLAPSMNFHHGFPITKVNKIIPLHMAYVMLRFLKYVSKRLAWKGNINSAIPL